MRKDCGVVPEQISRLLQEYTLGIKKIYGKSLKSVVLYGSYARNDYNEDSDQDIMILVDITEEQICKTRGLISEYTYEFNMQHDLDIKQIIKSKAQFDYWKSVYPFYKNVNREGIKIYEQRDE